MTRTFPLHRLLLAVGLLATLLAGPAEARRGGRFGSRGSRTYSAPASTRLAPGYVPPVSRSMTPRSSYDAPEAAPRTGYGYGASPYPRRGFGFGGGLLTGLAAGGLLGALFHHGGAYGAPYGGYGGGGGLAWLVQLAVLAGVAWLLFRLFRGRGTTPQPAYGGDHAAGPFGGSAPASSRGRDIAVTAADQDAFERLLLGLQDAFGREDYGALRTICTPEVMGYLAEELSDNATHGRRNEVRGTHLIDGEVSEAWREPDADWATVAMRYESVDVMRDRATDAVVAGDDRPSEVTELWTFTRPADGGPWKVAAIQET